MRIRIEKINLIIVSAILSLIVFIILTFVQNKLINYEADSKVLIAVEDIKKETKLAKEDFEEIYVPESLAKELKLLANFDEGMYNRTEIYKGQFLSSQLIGTKDDLKIIEGGKNKEKISIELSEQANMMAYQIKTGDKVNLYFTGKYACIENMIGKFQNVLVGNLTTVKILENEEILGIYDKDGVSSESEEFTVPSVIVFGVSKEKAEIINNLRNQGDFDITIG